ncbi:carbon starvation protein CstA [Escherichia coli DEC9A]|nr:carbon starvation protein CstA [Escherichia coli DEC9A]
MILGIIGAFCLAVVALRRGEHVSALWIVVASVSVYLVAYRYYSLYIAQKVMKLDPTRATPAVINNDGVDSIGQRNSYVKTWGCGGFLNETNIYSRGKSLCF